MAHDESLIAYDLTRHARMAFIFGILARLLFLTAEAGVPFLVNRPAISDSGLAIMASFLFPATFYKRYMGTGECSAVLFWVLGEARVCFFDTMPSSV